MDKLKNNKAPGIDCLLAQLFKIAAIEVAKELQDLVTHIWEEETIQTEWREGIVVPIQKGKGDSVKYENYCGITLINIAHKISVVV